MSYQEGSYIRVIAAIIIIMLIRISISILFIFISGYLLFQVRDNLISGMNPYIAGTLLIIGIVLLITSYIMVKEVSNKALKTSLHLSIVFVFIAAVLFFFFQQPKIDNSNPPRCYIETSDIN